MKCPKVHAAVSVPPTQVMDPSIEGIGDKVHPFFVPVQQIVPAFKSRRVCVEVPFQVRIGHPQLRTEIVRQGIQEVKELWGRPSHLIPEK